MGKGIINGRIVDESECTVSVLDRAFQYSYSIYEALKLKNGSFVHLSEHLARLHLSGKAIGFGIPYSDEEISSWLEKLKEVEKLSDATFRILVFGSEEVKVFVNHSPLNVYPESYYKEGVDVATYQAERFMPNVKTSNMLPSYLALASAEKKGCFEALLVSRDGYVLEGTRSNFYAIKNDKIYTAPDEMVLLGVTRTGLEECAGKLSLSVVEKTLTMDELFSMDGLFLTSTSMRAMPIKSVDGRSVPLSALDKIQKLSELIGAWE